MNIGNGIENLGQIFPAQSTSAGTAAKGSNPSQAEALGADKAQLSEMATQLAQSATASDVRLDRVASIQAALQAGTYDVPAGDVAQKVIVSMLESGK